MSISDMISRVHAEFGRCSGQEVAVERRAFEGQLNVQRTEELDRQHDRYKTWSSNVRQFSEGRKGPSKWHLLDRDLLRAVEESLEDLADDLDECQSDHEALPRIVVLP